MQIAVGGVSRLERHFFAFVHLDSGRDVGMPAVVSSLRLLAQWSTAVDRDGLHGCPPTVTFWPTSRLKKQLRSITLSIDRLLELRPRRRHLPGVCSHPVPALRSSALDWIAPLNPPST